MNIQRKKHYKIFFLSKASLACIFQAFLPHPLSLNHAGCLVPAKASCCKRICFLFRLSLHLDPGADSILISEALLFQSFGLHYHLIRKMLIPQQGEESHNSLLSFILNPLESPEQVARCSYLYFSICKGKNHEVCLVFIHSNPCSHLGTV